MWGVEEPWQLKGRVASTLQLYIWTWQMFVAELSVGSAPVLFIGRGRHGRIRHQPDLTWVCWWRQVTEEEVHLCRAVAAGHNFFFFGAVGVGNIEVEVSVAGTGLLILGAMLGGGTFLLGYAPHALPITCGRRAAVEGIEGSG